jgi:hypothetical protein
VFRRSRFDVVYLVTDDWNDYWTYRTQYHVTSSPRLANAYSSATSRSGKSTGTEIRLTALNVLRRGSRRPHIPAQFERLDEPFFSLGQDDDYFERLLNLPGSTGEETLVALRDIAFDNTIFEAVRGRMSPAHRCCVTSRSWPSPAA